MTIDKIKANLPDYIFDYWVNLIQLQSYEMTLKRMESAKELLEYEIKNNHSVPLYYIYELKLLELLID